MCSYKLDEDVNEIIYCHNGDAVKGEKEWLKDMESSSKSFNKLGVELKISNDELIEVQEFLKQLKMWRRPVVVVTVKGINWYF